MDRDEALEYVQGLRWWPTSMDSNFNVWGAPKEWSWRTSNGDWRLVHTVHDSITLADWQEARTGGVAFTLADDVRAEPAPAPSPNKYQRTVPSTTIDVYDVLTAYSVTNPATQHAVKKLLQPGNRGYKDTLTDLREALASIQRAIQIEEQSSRG